MNIKKIIPLIAITLIMFLVGNNKVLAYGDSTGYGITFTDSNIEQLETNINNMFNGSVVSSTFSNWVKNNLEVENSTYKEQYGKYYYCEEVSRYTQYCYMSNNEQDFKFELRNSGKNVINDVRVFFNRETTRLEFSSGNFSKASKLGYPGRIISSTFVNSKYKEYTNVENLTALVEPNGISSLDYVVLKDSSNNSYVLNNGDIGFYKDDETGKYVFNRIGYDGVKKPSLKYKTSITSNEESGRKSKVSLEFNENDSTINKFNYAQFKLQYGSTDFSNQNIPVFSHFRIYGKYHDSDDSPWQELNLSDFIIDDEKMSLEITDTSYDYVPGSLADATMTFQLNFFKTISSLYERWKIEFYFDNCDSSYFYLFDTLDNSEWLGYSDMFKDYMFYEFPSNYNYAFISSSDEVSSGRVYFPTHKVNEDYVRLNGKYYNIKTKKFEDPLIPQEVKEDDYYSFIDFEFDSSKYLFALNRYQGSHSELYFIKQDYNNILTHTLNLINGFFDEITPGSNKQNIDKYSHTFSKVNVIPSETAYFYVPIGYNVVFSNDASSVSVNTNNGYIDIDVSDTIDNNNSSDYYTSESKILSFIRKWWNNMIAPFKVFGQLKGIIENIHFDSNNSNVPKFEMDFSFFGVSQKQSIINFTWYLQYRDIIFNFIYLIMGSITITKVIHNLKRAFGGGN